uniref:Uncharacterized protein n=1 Tax=Ananas comosus var. bracteatus TaxID=296719 RepID=A0A6V7PUJ4_ANACO|nr:unnamed protein product [Ananas comosus var. bracteatus]
MNGQSLPCTLRVTASDHPPIWPRSRRRQCRTDRVFPVLRTESPMYVQGNAINTIRGFQSGTDINQDCIWSLPTSRHSGDSHCDSYSPCGIGRRSGLPWDRLIPRVGMMTTTGPLGSAPARQPTGGSQGLRQPSEPSAPAEARDRGKGIA